MNCPRSTDLYIGSPHDAMVKYCLEHNFIAPVRDLLRSGSELYRDYCPLERIKPWVLVSGQFAPKYGKVTVAVMGTMMGPDMVKSQKQARI